MVRNRQRASSRESSRGQAFTLEAFVASLVLLAAVLVALHSAATTANSASTTNRQVLVEETGLARGALDAAAANDSLKPTLLYWDDGAGSYYGTSSDGTYQMGGPPTAFGALLNRTLGNDSLAFNVDVRYLDANGVLRTRRLVHMGEPSDTGVRVSRTVTLYDHDRLYAANGTQTDTTLENATSFYVPPDASPGPVYNVVRVEVVAWRT